MYPCLYTVLINLEFLKMNKLTSLHSECLANMPMMLDVMTNTVEALSELLNPQYDRIEEYLTEFFDKHKKLRCQLDESWERGTVYAFTDHVTRYKKTVFAGVDTRAGTVLLYSVQQNDQKRRIFFL